jgi:hypothetical protein
MKVIKTSLLTGIAVLATASIPYTALAASCEREPQTFNLKVKVKNNKPTEVIHDDKDAEDLHVCIDDTIVWKLSGISLKKLFIEFPGDAPFSGDKKIGPGNKIEVTITGPERDEPYKYNIGIEDGEVWDPRIIVGR